MSASLTGMHDFIEALARRIPYVHPQARQFIGENLSAMRDAVEDPAKVLQLMNHVRGRVNRELAWAMEDAIKARDWREAEKLRSRAVRFTRRFPGAAPPGWVDPANRADKLVGILPA